MTIACFPHYYYTNTQDDTGIAMLQRQDCLLDLLQH
jgi:hypothetical protein